MADKKFTLTFDVEGNLAPIKGAVKDFQSTIKSAKFQIPVGIQGNIDKTISKLNAEIAEFESLTSQGFSNMADIGKAEKSFAKITSLMRQLGSQGEQIKGLDPKKFLPKEILDRTAKLEKAFNKLGDIKVNTKKIDAQTEAVKKQKEEVEELKTKYEVLAAENKTAGARKGNLSSSIKSKEKELEAIQQQMKALEQVKGGKSSAEYSRLNAEFKALSKTISAQKQEFASLDTSINKNKTTMSGLKVQLDSASSALDQMEESLKQLQASANVNEDLENLRKELAQLKNVNIDEIPSDLDEIKRIIGSLDDEQIKAIKNSLEGMGKAADGLVPSLEKTSKELEKTGQEGKELTRVGQEIENLKGQVLDFFSITNTIQIFKNAVRDAFDTVKELDAVMTETAVVTDFSIGDMWDKLPEYAEQANKLGTSIKDLYAANTLYYQQGLNSQQAMSVGVETMKMARIANMDAAKATEAMTAALRGFNMEINETSAGRINDVYSELAAITASDTEQIATAMSKTASIAASANMEFETTAALLAQIIETTQEAPETAGTAMKTIIARFTEVKELFSEGMITGEDSEGEEININKIDEALKTVGISLKDFLNGTKGIDDIFLELASKWDSLDLATQRYIATAAAGSRQQSRFIAMMSNYDRTMELVTAANNSAGASQKQFDKTLESLDAKLQRLSNAWDTFVMGLADNDVIKFGVDLLTKLLETVNNLTDDLGSTAGGIAKLGIAIAALKTGKNLFNSIFDITPLKQKLSEATGITGTFAQTLTKMGVSIKTETQEKIDEASASMNKFTGGLMAAGVACGALAQYLRSMGMEDFAKGLEIAGGALITVASGLNLVNSIAVAAGTTVPALLGSIVTAIAPVLPVVLGVAAAVGALVYILKKVYDRSAAGRLKAAQKDTQKAAEAAKEAAEEYNNLNTAISNIEDKTNALSELTKGTQEWRDAVVALNTEILDLVNTYPELASFLSNESGILKIDYDKTATNKYGKEYNAQDVLDSYLRRQTETQQIYNQRQIREKQAETELQFTKTVKDFIGNLSYLDIQKAESESSTGSAWEDARKIVDKLSIEIAKGNVQTDEQSLQTWFNANNLEMRDYEEFDYSVFKTYGDYLLSQQEAINGLTDATIAAHMAMLKLSNVSDEATEAVTNFDENILRDAYNAQLDEAKSREITKDDYLAYAEEMGYTYKREYKKSPRARTGRYVDRYYDEDNKKVTIDEDDVRDFIINRATNEDFTGVLQKMAEHYDNADEREQELFTEIFSNGLQELSQVTLAKYATLQNGQFGLDQSEKNLDALAQAMNFENFEDMAKILEIGSEQLASQLNEIFIAGGAEFIKARKNMVKNMSKYSSKDMQGYESNAAILSALELKFGERINSILDSVFLSLEKTGDQALVSRGYEQFRDVAMTSNEESMGQILSFIDSIDWSNPIDAVYTLNQEIQKGSGLTSDYAKGMMEIESSFFGAGNQMQYFLKSNDFKEMQEDLTEIVDLNGELTASDVLDLADDYKSLNKILKNTEATAGGVAKALQLVAEGKLGVHQLTDAIMASLEGFDSLNSLIAETLKTLEDFDPGPNENEVAEFINTAYETISENLKAGAVGNTQNFSYLDFLFPGWRDGKEGDELVAQMEYLAGKLEDNAVNMRRSWTDIANKKDIYGNEIQFDVDSGRTYEDLNVQDTGSEILLTGWEGKGMTTNDIVDWIADAYEVSDDYARMMLADFKNYSADLAVELNANDYAASIEKAYEELNMVKVGDVDARAVVDKKIIDESEIQAIATLYQQEFDDVYDYFEYRGTVITDFYDENGILEETAIIMAELDKVAQSGGVEGAQWIKQFIDGSSKNLNIDKLNTGLSNVGIPEDAKARITQDIIDSMMAASSAESMMVDVTLSDGSTTALEVTPQINLETAIANAETELANSKLADSIVSAFSNVTISPQVDTENMTDYVVTAIKAADGTAVVIAPDQESLNTLTSSVTGAAEAAKPYVYVSSNINSIISSINSISRTVTVTVKYNEVGKPYGSSQDTSAYWDSQRAKGIKNAPRAETSLVSEEGPELIQKASGGAYLSGTEGPEIVNIEKGDTVYTAEETRNILKSRSHNVIPRYASGYGYGTAYSGGKNASSKSDDDKEDWENSFDKLYNLVREIDEELRQRERLERRYEKLLESVDLTADKLFDNAVEQLKQLEKEKLLQKELQEARRQQISQYQSENSDLMKYAKIVLNERGEDVLRIHWDQINLVEDPEQGQRIEDYVSQLEEWMDGLNDIEDELNDIEDRIEEVRELGKDEYLDLENAIKDAVAFAYQEEIDKLSEINESINDTNTQLIDAISKQVNRIRQQRENENTERELQEKQRQLQYLQQDTSGANAMEILQLQKEIDEGQRDYTDSLIDQKISELQEQNDEAATQREQQITLMQAQLDHLIQSGEIWDEVYSLMDEGLDPEAGLVRGSRLEQLLKSADGFNGMSKVQQMDWLKELQQQAAQAVTYMRLTTEKIDTAVELNKQNYFGSTTPEPEYNGSSSGGSGSTGGSSSAGSTGSTGSTGGTVNKTPKSYQASYSYGGWSGSASSTTETGARSEITRQIEAKYNAEINRINNLTGVLFSEKTEMKNSAQNKKNRALQSVKVVAQYKKGGLADFTGPAWLDGTKSRPEMVLNARDTQNFIQLKDILASIMERGSTSNTSTENNGDITYDIDINVESIGSDYDVEQVANKVKSMIGENARYRNNNTVSLAR